ncbi:hypothetical protein L226DRAFT_51599 [Lentinus tigrinus ALCF2SS1-7]|uniref:uncharacterized protein n=1 Tax=Lentinus tigrinus ALCF2SS1-7 TaxID=1328758 RepID=UPI0011661CBB|nr:hypothetical protein L226DRAFT_51599 [Lentinus tigrinus ALCF2SS1-7]
MPRYIPPEITDDVISAAALTDIIGFPDTHTLAMCALVCRTWLPRSRAKLFETIYIGNQRRYNLLVERVLHSETMSRYLASVNVLCIYEDKRHNQFLSSIGGRPFLVEFAGKLPGLRQLIVSGIDWTHQRPSVRWHLPLSQFRTITTLRLENSIFSSFNDVRRILTALPLLSNLSTSCLTWHTVSQALHLQMTPHPVRTYWPELHTLSIYYALGDPRDCAETFLKWITAALGGSTIKVLTYGFYSGLPLAGSLREAVVAFMGCVRQSVTYLDVTFDDSLSLSGFVALEHLSLSFRDSYGNWENVASVLQDVSLKTLHSVHLYNVDTQRKLDLWSDSDLLHFDHDTLEALDCILSREPFERPKEVTFEVDAHLDDQEEVLRAHATRCLPELHKRKILRLTFHGLMQRLEVDGEH